MNEFGNILLFYITDVQLKIWTWPDLIDLIGVLGYTDNILFAINFLHLTLYI